MKEETAMDQAFKLPHEWFDEGKDWLARGNFDEARRAFEQALELDPYYPQALCGLSKVLWQKGEYREAVEKINEALAIDPDDPEVIEQCASIFMAVGQKENALDVLNAYLARNPWDDEVRELLKRLEKTPVEAVTTSSVSAPPTKPQESADNSMSDLLVKEGESQYEKGKIDRARMCFEMALEHNPHHAKAHNSLGVILWELGDLMNALDHFQQAFHENPFDQDIVFNSFNALIAAGFLEDARELMKLHIQHNPFNDEAWKLYDEVSSLLCRISWTGEGLAPEVGEIYVSMGKELYKAQDFYGAAEALHKALTILPQHPKALKRLARIHRTLGHVDEALNFYRDLLSAENSNDELAIEYADYLVELGRHDEAINFLETRMLDHHSDILADKIKTLKKDTE
jgi:tetratricopeptide (TPR) repeat protein